MAKQLPSGEAAMNDYYGKYISGAKKRKLDFQLSKQEFSDLVFSNCHYCGGVPKRDHPGLSLSKKDKYNGHIIVNGIDRKDPKIGYIRDNCVPACDVCNFGKQQLDGIQFEEWIKKVYNFLFGTNLDI
jgi:hypothetical protein